MLSRTGQKESATLQPFFTLQLEVQSPLIQSVNDALEKFIATERIPDYTCSKTKTEVIEFYVINIHYQEI